MFIGKNIQILFGVIIFNTVSFCGHFHAYEVAETSLHNIVNIEELEFPYTEILRQSESKHFVVIRYAKQKHPGCKKSARPIRSNMQAGRCDQKL